jgi:hypothetical protein
MPPKRKAPIDPNAPNKAAKKEAIVSTLRQQFEPSSVVFTPLQPELPRPASANLPTSFPPILQATPFDYFTLFFTPELYKLIARNTNTYAATQRMQKDERQREWRDIIHEDIMVFIGVVIYMGVHLEADISSYWSTQPTAPTHILSSYISLRRYKQIKRYLHISCATTDISNGLQNSEQWWYKIEPLSSYLLPLFRQYYIPSSYVAIDELIVRCFGRSAYTYKMPNKPIKQGYKLYDIADHGYVYSWIWSSKKYGLEGILPQEGLTNTGALVHALISTLPRSGITIYMDNYFTSVPLFESLRTKAYGAVGTTRAHEAFSKELV